MQSAPEATRGQSFGRSVTETRKITWSVLAHQDMRRFFIGNSLSNVGTWLQNTAQILLAYQISHSAGAVGLVMGAQFVSPLLLGPVAGAVADRFDRRQILLVTHLGSAGVCSLMAVLQFTGSLDISALVGGAFLVGVGFTFTLPALTALVPALVPRAERRSALAMNGVSSNAGRALAPVLGVGVVLTIGFAWAFVLNAVSFLVLAAILTRLRPRHQSPAKRAPLLDGLRIVSRWRRLQVILLMVAASTVATDPPLVLGPSLATGFGVSETASAYFLAAFGAGTIIGSLTRSRWQGLGEAGGYLAMLGCAIVCFSLASTLWVAIVAVTVAGMASLLVGSATQALILDLVGASQAGRVMAVWVIAYVGSRPLATAADSWFADIVGARTSGVLLALPSLAIATVILGLKASERGRRWGKAALRGRPVAVSASSG